MDRKVRAILDEEVAKLSGEEKERAAMLESEFDAQLQLLRSPWLRFFVSYDPGAALRQVRCPVLALIGSKDLQVVPEPNLRAIERALREGGNGDFTVEEMPSLNHLFQTCTTGSLDEMPGSRRRSPPPRSR